MRVEDSACPKDSGDLGRNARPAAQKTQEGYENPQKAKGAFRGQPVEAGVQPPPQRVEKVAKGHFFEFFQRFFLTIAPGRQTLQRAKP